MYRGAARGCVLCKEVLKLDKHARRLHLTQAAETLCNNGARVLEEEKHVRRDVKKR